MNENKELEMKLFVIYNFNCVQLLGKYEQSSL